MWLIIIKSFVFKSTIWNTLSLVSYIKMLLCDAPPHFMTRLDYCDRCRNCIRALFVNLPFLLSHSLSILRLLIRNCIILCSQIQRIDAVARRTRNTGTESWWRHVPDVWKWWYVGQDVVSRWHESRRVIKSINDIIHQRRLYRRSASAQRRECGLCL